MLRFLVLACAFSAIQGADECGVPEIPPTEMSAHIVGGVEAEPNSWPWMTEVIKYGGHYCGGALINDQWVVSAAHCFDDHMKANAVHEFALGGHWSASHRNSDLETTRKVFGASKTILHPAYEKDGKGYDIALIKLDKKVTFNKWITPVCLPDKRPKDEQMVYVTGWGALEYKGKSPDKLHQVSVPVVSQSDCIDAYGRTRIDDTMICAGRLVLGGKDSCQGDSGGPMVEKIPGNFGKHHWALVGVVSWGSGCAEAGYPGVYTDVHNLRGWIETTVAQNS